MFKLSRFDNLNFSYLFNSVTLQNIYFHLTHKYKGTQNAYWYLPSIPLILLHHNSQNSTYCMYRLLLLSSLKQN